MTRYVARRVALSVVALFLLVTIVFLIVNVFPSDPGRSIAGPFAPQETVDKINGELGTNDPLTEQYGRISAELRHVATATDENGVGIVIEALDPVVCAGHQWVVLGPGAEARASASA